jgi:NADPH-dependent 7-cyano-7-deazaguanine reductase QueF
MGAIGIKISPDELLSYIISFRKIKEVREES